MNKKIVIFVIFLLSGIIIMGIEFKLRAERPEYLFATLSEIMDSEFKEFYVDIYKKFFKKLDSEGQYVSQKFNDCTISFPIFKNRDTVRIFIIGGSVAARYEITYLAEPLERAIPAKKFEIINCGMGGYDSYRVYLVLKEILHYKPDFIIVLSGNNENNYSQSGFNLLAYNINNFLRRSLFYRALQQKISQFLYKKGILAERRDINKRMKDYERYLRLMAKAARAKRTRLILCTLPFNFRDCGLLGGKVPYQDKEFVSAQLALDKRDYGTAVRELKEFLTHQPDDKFGLYSLGRAYDETGHYTEAQKYYLKALDLDAECRATPTSNKIVRKVCVEEDMELVDLERAFINAAPHGLCGKEQFYDFCHWHNEYYYLVSELVAREMIKNRIRYPAISKAAIKNNLSDKSSFRAFCLPKKRSDCDIEEQKLCSVEELLLTSYNNRDQTVSERAILCFKTLYFMDRNQLLKIRCDKEKIRDYILECMSDNEYVKNISVENYWPIILYHVGETYRRLRLYKEAVLYFKEAAALKKDYYLPYLGLTLTYHTLGDKKKTRYYFRQVEALSDGFETLKSVLF